MADQEHVPGLLIGPGPTIQKLVNADIHLEVFIVRLVAYMIDPKHGLQDFSDEINQKLASGEWTILKVVHIPLEGRGNYVTEYHLARIAGLKIGKRLGKLVIDASEGFEAAVEDVSDGD